MNQELAGRVLLSTGRKAAISAPRVVLALAEKAVAGIVGMRRSDRAEAEAGRP